MRTRRLSRINAPLRSKRSAVNAGRLPSCGCVARAVVTSVGLAELRIVDPSFVAAVRERTLDAYQRYRPREFQKLPVRVVDIDERSLALHGQWPWPRTRVAEL